MHSAVLQLQYQWKFTWVSINTVKIFPSSTISFCPFYNNNEHSRLLLLTKELFALLTPSKHVRRHILRTRTVHKLHDNPARATSRAHQPTTSAKSHPAHLYVLRNFKYLITFLVSSLTHGKTKHLFQGLLACFGYENKTEIVYFGNFSR